MLAVPRIFFCHRNWASRLLTGVAAVAILASPAAAAEFEADIVLGGLGNGVGVKFLGGAIGYDVGNSVAAGDVNGDGIDDAIIGAFRADPNGEHSGAVYVVFGKQGGHGSLVELSALDGSNGFRMSGEAENDYAGRPVAAAGDINGDGYGDVIVGASVHSPGGLLTAGAAYVVFGRKSGFPTNLQLSSLNGNNGFQISGSAQGEGVGTSVAGVGDVNGDGYDDVIAGAGSHDSNGFINNGAAYVVFGKKAAFNANIQVSALNGSNGFQLEGEGEQNRAGQAVAGAGDINGDGIDDLLVGAPLANAGGVLDSGASYVVFGRDQSAGGFPALLNFSSLDGGTGFQMSGEGIDDNSGQALAAAGDVDGDGFDDIIVGAPDADSEAGKAYVVFGKDTSFSSVISLADLIGFNGFKITGVSAGDSLGVGVGGNSDVNGDGYDDLLIGSDSAESNGLSENGVSYVLFGKGTPFVASIGAGSLTGTNGFRMSGEDGSASGENVAAGDFNGDGFGDVLVGARRLDGTSVNSTGGAHILYGRAPDGPVTRDGNDANQKINGGPFIDALNGEDGNDILEGRSSGDALDGGPGVNTASYAHASGAVKASLSAPGTNTGHAAGDSYTLITGLEGSRFADTLTGDDAANRITGRKGKDKLKGGKGKDTFGYLHINESPKGKTKRDVIVDFKSGSAATTIDKIDVSAIDANAAKNGNQAFTFIGTSAFSKRGQLRVTSTGAGILVQGNTQGSTGADFEILLKGLSNTGAFKKNDFKL